MTASHIIDEILMAMTAAGMTQRELAQALGVTDARVSQMLRPTCGLRPSTIDRVRRAVANYKRSPVEERDWQAVAASQAAVINAQRAKIRRMTTKLEKLTGESHEDHADDRRCRHGKSGHRCTGTCRGHVA